jgi:hypothetical protein
MLNEDEIGARADGQTEERLAPANEEPMLLVVSSPADYVLVLPRLNR